MRKKPPLISKDRECAYFYSAHWALGKQDFEKPKGPFVALRPKLQAMSVNLPTLAEGGAENSARDCSLVKKKKKKRMKQGTSVDENCMQKIEKRRMSTVEL